MARERITSFDVAREAGVSQSAVSRAYTSGASISKATKDKVFAAASKLGYQPNAIARSLISRRSNMIGIVMADIINPFYPAVLDMFMRRFQERGHRVLLFMASRDQNIDDLLPQLLEYQVDGLVITSSTLSSEMADHCTKLGTPVILFNRYVPNVEASSVCCDNIDAGRSVADLFLSAGHQQLAYIAGIENTSTNQDREHGFSSRIKERRAQPVLRETGHYTYEGGYQAALRLFQQQIRPDAIFCANDIMALGAMDALRGELKLRIPDDVSIIGFDDIASAAWQGYRLTSIRPPVGRMVDATVNNLIERIENPEIPLAALLETVDLVVRDSARLPEHLGLRHTRE
ncbi:LacI family DNA-binding transcriptional regulator [Marinobacterium rhizophilum]|uniref:LacI family DNA-binding transcriptional regulator n=1 Tax=Marinobacterium rhizophilum TaxID=420402 RepID=A0ABY5HL90_9GAMM|nr:LacI family DNA-binding transcriptional regulator [Marinobacterium rhizophilum]UTW11990.1 LacI family DNA-binding transcriptional regulator [Marinobacterium rhizophilum]